MKAKKVKAWVAWGIFDVESGRPIDMATTRRDARVIDRDLWAHLATRIAKIEVRRILPNFGKKRSA